MACWLSSEGVKFSRGKQTVGQVLIRDPWILGPIASRAGAGSEPNLAQKSNTHDLWVFDFWELVGGRADTEYHADGTDAEAWNGYSAVLLQNDFDFS